MLRHAVRALFWTILRFIYRIDIHRSKYIPKTGAAVLAPNHVSYIDAILISSHIRRPVRFAMHWKIYKGLKWLVAPMGAFPIASKEENEAIYNRAFEIMAETLEAGKLVCIFPEGMLTRNGNMNPFRNGILKIIERNPVPVIPIALTGLWGSYFSRKKDGVFKLPDHFMAKIRMIVGRPMEPPVEIGLLEKEVRDLIEVGRRL